MKKILGLSLLAVVLAVSSASAVRLVNKDYSSYEVKITCNGSTRNTHIGAGSTADLGSGPCTVTLVKSGSTTNASGSQDIYIKNGGFSAN